MSKIYVMNNKLPLDCPSCGHKLKVKSLQCENCKTTIDGSFDLPLLTRLSLDDQEFVLHFILSSGSLKEMAKHLNLSYPTVRNMLDELIRRLNKLNETPK